MDAKAAALAGTFSAFLLRDIGAENLAEVVHRNALDASGRFCASHDYCDANETMLEAMEACGIPTDDLDASSSLIDAAWDLAKANGFEVAK